MEVFVVYNDDKQLKELGEFVIDSPFFTFIDDRTYRGRKEAWRLKGQFSAKLSPFAVVYNNNKPIKAFYSEAENVIQSLITYLNENNLCR